MATSEFASAAELNPKHRSDASLTRARRIYALAAITTGLTLAAPVAIASDSPDELCPSGSWNPKVEFQLEERSYKETLIWLSGWSHALTAMGRSEAKSESPQYCLPECGMIMSKPLLDFLNSVFKGQTITSDQATEALWGGIQILYRCNKK